MSTRSKFICAIIWLVVLNFSQSLSSSDEKMSGSKPDAASVQTHIDKVTSCIAPPVIAKGEQPDCKTLAQRMAFFHVPGVSIAVIHNGTIE